MSESAAFVYGTLMADEVVHKLIKRIPVAKPATLYGFSRHRIKGVVYPAIVPSTADSAVDGKVLLSLTDKEINILDLYEAEEYYRQTVEPVLEDGTKITADVYIWKDEFRPLLLAEEWSYDIWRTTNAAKWVDELEPMEAHPTGEDQPAS